MYATATVARRPGKTAMVAQVKAIQDAIDSVRVGACNVNEDRTRCSPSNPLDAFCDTCFRRLPKEYRDELRQARDIWSRQLSDNARVNAYRAYAMRIIGARLWLKKNASG